MHAPSEDHLQVVMRILRYLKATPSMGLLFCKNDLRATPSMGWNSLKTITCKACSDVDYAGFITNRKSTSWYCTFVGDNLVAWRSKQPVVARSSVEVEYQVMALGICELMWIKTLLKELRVDIEEPMTLYCDNKAAISIAHNPIQHDHTKHVEVDRHFIKEKINNALICTPFVSSKLQ